TSDDDIVFGVGLGCKGVITLLIEPVRPNQAVDFLGFTKSCLQDRVIGIAATVIRTRGSVDAKPGARVVAREGLVVSDIADKDLADSISRRLRLVREGSSMT